MTTLTELPVLGRVTRLLGPAPEAPLPAWDLATLVAATETAGLTGRGGAGFPTAIKLRALEGRGAVVVGNAMEGEPLSRKDAVLLHTAPGLVFDGLRLVGHAVGASRQILAVGPHLAAPMRPDRRIEVISLTGGFVAGQETALVNQLNGGAAVPRDPAVRVTTRGVDGRPTVVLNAETLAQLALLARYGPEWFRSVGTPADPGSSLFTISGAVGRPGVVEAARGTSLAEVLTPAAPERFSAVLVGGYHGAWVPVSDVEVGLDRESLAAYGVSIGAGVLHVLGVDRCSLRTAAEFVTYLADESAGQCGPCVNGLPRLAERLGRLARCDRDTGLPADIAGLQALVSGRGACAHPDGTVRLVGSTLRVFADHVEEHLAGRCSIEGFPGGGRR